MCGNAHKTNKRSGRLLRPREGKRASRASRQNACASLFWHDRGAAADAKGVNLEFTLKDSLGRDWQCGTIQVDFNLPQRLGAEYVGKDNQ